MDILEKMKKQHLTNTHAIDTSNVFSTKIIYCPGSYVVKLYYTVHLSNKYYNTDKFHLIRKELCHENY